MRWPIKEGCVMSGNSLLLDTNALIYYLEGRSKISHAIEEAAQLYFSVISEIELLSAPHLTERDKLLIQDFLALCHKIELTPAIVEQTIAIRRQYRLKIPDAIIAASAIWLNCTLASADAAFAKIPHLTRLDDIVV